jgi:hypothetical protein
MNFIQQQMAKKEKHQKNFNDKKKPTKSKLLKPTKNFKPMRAK